MKWPLEAKKIKNMINAKTILLIILLIILGILGHLNYQKYYNLNTTFNYMDNNEEKKSDNEGSKTVNRDLHYYDEVKMVDEMKTLIDFDLIEQMAPNRNDIPPLVEPAFVTVSYADSWISDEMKVALYIGDDGTQVVYPLAIMRWHQVLIDDVDGRPIVVTHCPFSGVVAVYDRRVEGNELNFGVSGKIFNSNTLIFDEETDSLWQQINGVAVSGEYTEKQLTRLPVSLIEWGNVRDRYPDAQVLSRKNAFQIDYTEKPYGNYDLTMDIFYKVRSFDTLFHPKAFAIGFGDLDSVQKNDTASTQKIYLLEEVHKVGFINDKIKDMNIFIYEEPQTMEVLAFNREVGDDIYNIKLDFETDKLISKEGEWQRRDEKLVLIGDIEAENDEIKDVVSDSKIGDEQKEIKEIKLKRIPVTFGYWFAWRAFYPDATVFTTNVAGFRQSFKDRE